MVLISYHCSLRHRTPGHCREECQKAISLTAASRPCSSRALAEREVSGTGKALFSTWISSYDFPSPLSLPLHAWALGLAKFMFCLSSLWESYINQRVGIFLSVHKHSLSGSWSSQSTLTMLLGVMLYPHTYLSEFSLTTCWHLSEPPTRRRVPWGQRSCLSRVYDLISSTCRSAWHPVGRCMTNICERKDVNKERMEGWKKEGRSVWVSFAKKVLLREVGL